MPRAKPAPAPVSGEPIRHSAKDVADFLGVGPDTVYRLVKRKEIAFVTVNGVIRFRKSDVDAYLRKNTVAAGSTNVSGAAKQRFGMK